jgi:hypothetical protein
LTRSAEDIGVAIAKRPAPSYRHRVVATHVTPAFAGAIMAAATIQLDDHGEWMEVGVGVRLAAIDQHEDLSARSWQIVNAAGLKEATLEASF